MTSDTWAELPPVISWGRECHEPGLTSLRRFAVIVLRDHNLTKEQEPKNGYKRINYNKIKFKEKKTFLGEVPMVEEPGGSSTETAFCLLYIGLTLYMVLTVVAI